MCGIFAIVGATSIPISELRKRAIALSQRQRHRGPDWSGYRVDEKTHTVLAHERLAIVDLENGAQPLVNDKETVWLTVNGEIYNHKYLRQDLRKKYKFKTNSDCEPIIYLYEEFGTTFLNRLSGDFAFVLFDSEKNRFLAARDPIGVCPLYVGYGKDGSIWFSSELKSLQDDCESFEPFPPGHFYTSDMPKGQYQRYYDPPWWNPDHIPAGKSDHMLTKIRESLEQAVVKRMMSDVPYGVLLSGGLDSSLVAAIASRHAENRVEEDEKQRAWWPRIHSFCIGLKGAPDLVFAKQVADFLGTVHHEFHFTVQDGIDALQQVIWHLETYDVTTIRASTPMFLLARRIKAMGVKMVLSGEGSDEIFGGYLYFHRAPNAVEFHKETVRRVKALHLADCLRANKSTAAWGLEVRVPFLDKDFLDVAMSVDPQEKMCSKEKIEKYILRKAFDTPERPFLPHSILWRQKEQFSDGVGYSWINGLKDHAAKEVSDEKMAAAAQRFPEDTPATKEAYFYRTMFEELFPSKNARATVAKWTPTWSDSTDPSGRVQAVHIEALPDAKKP